MNTQYTTPKDWQFFQSYAGLLSTLHILGYIAQLISALTEFGVIYTLVRQSVAETFPEYAAAAALSGAILGTAFLEVGLRRFLPYSFRVFYFQRYRGLHLAISLPLLAVTVALVFASGYLSFYGSREIVQQSAPPPRADSDAPIQRRAARDKAAALALWATDSALLEARFEPRLAGAEWKHKAVLQREAQAWRNRGKGMPRTRSTELEALRTAERANLLQQKAEAFQKAQEVRDTRLQAIEAQKAAAIARVTAHNRASERSNLLKTNHYGNSLAWFTVLAMGVLIFSIGIQEAHRKGSGMEEVLAPHTPGLWEELTRAVGQRIEQLCRTWIRRLAGRNIPATYPGQKPIADALSRFHDRDMVQAPLASPAFTLLDEEPQDPLCQYCHTPYMPNTSWQKFCSTECRLAFHGAKHGRVYLPTRVYRARKGEKEKNVRLL